jgi:hypothetical protein
MKAHPRLTPEAEHLAEQERLLEELTEHLTAKEAEFAGGQTMHQSGPHRQYTKQYT